MSCFLPINSQLLSQYFTSLHEQISKRKPARSLKSVVKTISIMGLLKPSDTAIESSNLAAVAPKRNSIPYEPNSNIWTYSHLAKISRSIGYLLTVNFFQ